MILLRTDQMLFDVLLASSKRINCNWEEYQHYQLANANLKLIYENSSSENSSGISSFSRILLKVGLDEVIANSI